MFGSTVLSLALALSANASDAHNVVETRLVTYDQGDFHKIVLEDISLFPNEVTQYKTNAIADDGQGSVYVHDWQNNRLVRWDIHENTMTPLYTIKSKEDTCGLAFMNGELYGIDRENNRLVRFDTDTGLKAQAMKLKKGGSTYNLRHCGLTFNEAEQTLVGMDVRNGTATIFDIALDGTTSSWVTLDPSISWENAGIQYDKHSRGYYVTTDSRVYKVSPDGTASLLLQDTAFVLDNMAFVDLGGEADPQDIRLVTYDSGNFHQIGLENMSHFPYNQTDYDINAIAADGYGMVYAHDWKRNKLVRWDIDAGTMTRLGKLNSSEDTCGLAFRYGELYGIDRDRDQLIRFDTDTGLKAETTRLKKNGSTHNLRYCGLTFNEAEQTLVGMDVRNGTAKIFYIALDGTTSSWVTLDPSISWQNAGIQYDKYSEGYYVTTDSRVYKVSPDGTADLFLDSAGFVLDNMAVLSNVGYVGSADDQQSASAQW